MGDDFGNPDQA
jgi:dynein intermediate chain 1